MFFINNTALLHYNATLFIKTVVLLYYNAGLLYDNATLFIETVVLLYYNAVVFIETAAVFMRTNRMWSNSLAAPDPAIHGSGRLIG